MKLKQIDQCAHNAPINVNLAGGRGGGGGGGAGRDLGSFKRGYQVCRGEVFICFRRHKPVI